ncbi:MAG: M56 and DUF3738 domain-containing protein [Bryobacteraceae bacterium]
MNAIQFLSSQPWVERLGWTLVHFLWQGAVIAAVYAAVRKGIPPSSSPNTRYILACAALAAMLAAPFATWYLVRPADAAPVAAHLAGRASSAAPATIIALPASVSATISDVRAGQFLSWVVVTWLTGAMAFWARLMGGWVVAARMRSTQVRPAPPEWRRALGELGARIGLSRPVRLLVSALVEAPAVVGWLRPVVLVPVGALAGIPAEQMEALLIHELAHIRRHDYLVNLLQSVAEALLFYHPAVWWVSGHIRAERELCCDDVAARASGDALTYARALAELESHRPAHLNAALAASGGSLADRIARLLGQSRPVSQTRSGMGAIVTAILLTVTAFGLFGQSDAAPRFEVASVKRNISAPHHMIVRPRPGGGMFAENAPLIMLIENAYSVQAFQISGGPSWIQSDGYDIEAKVDGKAGRAETFLMLRSLLEDRFQLKLHRETKELPVYALTVAKSGLKLQQPKEGSCIPLGANGQLPRSSTAPVQHAPGFPCGMPGVMMEPSGVRLEGGKVAMPDFIRVLGMVLGRPVVDRTGFTGTFDLRLDFTPDEAVAGLPRSAGAGNPESPPAAADPTGPPPIFTAIQEQLGLKLESAKGPVEVLVIDHVERRFQN